MTDNEIEILFRSWWSQAGYTSAPPGTHALMTHLGWGRFLHDYIRAEAQQQHREQQR